MEATDDEILAALDFGDHTHAEIAMALDMSEKKLAEWIAKKSSDAIIVIALPMS